MNTKLKIAISIGSTLLVGGVGYLIYRKITKQNEAARVYLKEVDDNGGTPIKRFSKSLLNNATAHEELKSVKQQLT